MSAPHRQPGVVVTEHAADATLEEQLALAVDDEPEPEDWHAWLLWLQDRNRRTGKPV